MGVECTGFHGIVNGESLWNLFCCLLCKFYYWTTPILKTLGQIENLVFVIMSTRENIRLIARTSFSCKQLEKSLLLFVYWKPIKDTLTNSEGPDDMLQSVAYYQGLYCLLRYKQSSGTEIYQNFGKSNLWLHDIINYKPSNNFVFFEM